MAVAAAPLAIASVGLQVMGSLQAAQGQAAGYRHAAAQADRKAMAARTAADQTDAGLRDELMTTLGNIGAIRAAAGVGSSPTELAIMDREREVSERQRRIRVGNLLSQAAQSEDDAGFYRYAAGSALGSGYLGAFGKGLGGLAALGKA